MNKDLQKYARSKLKEGLCKLTPTHRRFFARMYSHKNLWLTVDEMVEQMPANRLDWAMTQIENTLKSMDRLMKEYHDTM